MQDAIILYENGKAIGGEGHPTNASDITFENTGTDLVSENVEDAIVEVNAKFDRGSVSVTADGTKTHRQLLDGIFSSINFADITEKSILIIGSVVMQIATKDANQIVYGASFNSGGAPYSQSNFSAFCKASNSSYVFTTASNGSVTGNNYTGEVPTGGTKVTLYY